MRDRDRQTDTDKENERKIDTEMDTRKEGGRDKDRKQGDFHCLIQRIDGII